MATPDHAAFRSRQTFESLDGLRCLSIVPVVFHHAAGGLDLGRLGRRGFLGVDMFFVISGFLIVTLLLRERARHGSLSLLRFSARRALRIMPLYYGVLLVLALAFATLAKHGSQAAAFFTDLPYYLTYTTNWYQAATFLSITWSLSAEEQFYLVWPTVEKYVPRPLVLLAVLLVVSQLIQFRVLDSVMQGSFGFAPAHPTMLFQTTFTPILLGVLLAHVLHDAKSFAWVWRACGANAAPPVIYALLCAGLVWLPEDLSGLPRLGLHLLMTALVASVVMSERHSLSPLLEWPPVRRLGALSYGIYLLHMPVIAAATVALARLRAPMQALFFVSLAASWLLAELSYRFYEAPFLRMKHRFAR